MHAEAARLMLEVAICRSLKEIRQGDCRRALRSLAEDGRHFIRRGYARKLLTDLQSMLKSEAHPYFDLFSHLANALDSRYLTGYCLNLCYESWIRGTLLLRQQQKRLGVRIPWVISLDLDGLGVTHAMQLMDQGMALGIMCYIFHSAQVSIEALQALSSCYPRCALALMAPDDALTDEVLRGLEGTDNMLLVALSRGSFTSAPALRAHKRMYALCRTVDEDGILRLMDTGDLSCPGDQECAFPVLLPERSVSQELCLRMNDWLEQLRQSPLQPVFPVDMRLDYTRVDRLISGGSRPLTVSADGEYLRGTEKAATGMHFPDCSLEELLKAC